MGDVSAPRSRVPGEGSGDAALGGGLVRVDEDLLPFRAQPHSPTLGFDGAVLGAELPRAQECQDGLVDEEGAELLHEVECQAGAFVGGRVGDAEAGFESGGVERSDAFSQEHRVPVGQRGVGQVARRASAASVEGDVGGDARGEGVEVGGGAGSFDAHDVVDRACVCEAASPVVHVGGRVGEVEARVAPGDAGEHVDLPADLRADEGGRQANAARLVAREVALGEEPGRVLSPPRSYQGALVGAAA